MSKPPKELERVDNRPGADMPADVEPKMREKDWEEMFPPLLVA